MTSVAALAVVVPARDEERLLPACLDSLAFAVQSLTDARPTIACRVFVVLDSCVDGTADIVAGRRGVTAVPVAAGRVGAARAAGVEAAAEWARGVDPSRTWVASTDADTVVPPHWLTAQVALAADGHALVVGTVLPDPRDLTDHEHALWRERHVLGDGHEHVHGANLGFTLAAYRRVGGFPHLPVHEDVELVRALRASGVSWIAAGGVAAVTSGRREARAPHGFAAYLDGLGA
ncbi:glycosyltransferase [Nocardioides sp. Soil777]|uniref:glycosyltransferase n=1 Tax=Nocardioides sp. Soil777 TaxID=1736409 RepID=UPI000AEC5153|nr:glycosyltransferase [Nocardioides sp. Soil777]